MEFTIEGTYPVLRCKMDNGEQLLTGSGAMSRMTDGIENDTKMTGGLMGGLKRGLTGDNMFMNTYYIHNVTPANPVGANAIFMYLTITYTPNFQIAHGSNIRVWCRLIK